MIQEVAPTYPDEAKEAGLEGDVVLLIYITERGKVARAIVQAHNDADGNPITDWDESTPAMEALDKAAIEAALKYEFEPARMNGERVGIWYLIVITFRL